MHIVRIWIRLGAGTDTHLWVCGFPIAKAAQAANSLATQLHKWVWVRVPNRKHCTSRQFSVNTAAQVSVGGGVGSQQRKLRKSPILSRHSCTSGGGRGCGLPIAKAAQVRKPSPTLQNDEEEAEEEQSPQSSLRE